jgi:hypothetical protein
MPKRKEKEKKSLTLPLLHPFIQMDPRFHNHVIPLVFPKDLFTALAHPLMPLSVGDMRHRFKKTAFLHNELIKVVLCPIDEVLVCVILPMILEEALAMPFPAFKFHLLEFLVNLEKIQVLNSFQKENENKRQKHRTKRKRESQL